MELLLVLAIGVGGWFAWRAHRANVHGAKTMSTREDKVLSQVEGLMWQHWKAARDGDTPETVARLVRDDLQNARVKDPLAYKWATPETAGRVFRNFERELRAVVVTEIARANTPAQTAAQPVETAVPALPPRSKAVGEATVVRLKTCRDCGTENRGAAYKCRKCGEVFATGPEPEDVAENRCPACNIAHAAGKSRCRKCGGWLPAARD